MVKVIEILKTARALISDPANWIQNSFATNKQGVTCPSHSREATCWCATGAIFKAENGKDIGGIAEGALMETLGTRHYDRHVPQYNDSHTHAEVLQLFDVTIERLEAECSSPS